MTNLYGPWATAIDTGGSAQLSSFWKQRLTMLVPASQTSPVLSWRNLLGLVAAAALVGILPTFLVAPAVAEQEKVVKKSEPSQAPAVKPNADVKAVRVQGKVIDENGKPVASAEIWTQASANLYAKADSQGRFALEVPPVGDYPVKLWKVPVTLWAYAAGRQVGCTSVALWPDGASDVVLLLGPAADTSFVVLDPNGRPCRGALVEPYRLSDGMGYAVPPKELLSRGGARTDAEGRVKLPVASREVLKEVRITSRDFGIQLQRTEGNEPGAIVGKTIRLRRVGKIEGRVLADRPEIARGVRLSLTTYGIENREDSWPTDGFAAVESDEQGRFVVPAIAAGGLMIYEESPDWNANQPLRPKLPVYIEVKADKTTALQIPMAPTILVRSSIRAKDTSQPIPDTLVRIIADPSPEVRNSVSDPQARSWAENQWPLQGNGEVFSVSDAQGKYTGRVLPGSVRLTVERMPEQYAKKYIQSAEDAFREYEVPKDAKEFDLPPLEVIPTQSIR